MPYRDAQYMEVDLAIRLQQLGYGVWQNWFFSQTVWLLITTNYKPIARHIARFSICSLLNP
jgi:hypothetical protein